MLGSICVRWHIIRHLQSPLESRRENLRGVKAPQLLWLNKVAFPKLESIMQLGVRIATISSPETFRNEHAGVAIPAGFELVEVGEVPGLPRPYRWTGFRDPWGWIMGY